MEEWCVEINELQSRIYEALRSSEDTSDLIDGLICVNCPLGKRYRLLPMEQLFKDNSNVRLFVLYSNLNESIIIRVCILLAVVGIY